MPDYKEMYATLFRETTKAIGILQTAQQQTEEIYIADGSENGSQPVSLGGGTENNV